MKITTDACIQGAWTPIPAGAQRVLDIGTGTGLLSLMTAQRSADVMIDAIEIDESAAMQAAANFSASPWHKRLKVDREDIRTFRPEYKYDLIVCNPPFFVGSLKSDSNGYNIARHATSLSRDELATSIVANLGPDGKCAILLPFSEYYDWLAIASKHGLYPLHSLHIRHRNAAPVKRIVSIMSRRGELQGTVDQLTIQDDSGEYTDAFRKLLSSFYLNII
jgi:tRNA1Val (adenine37-N6)-methyltransferase